MLLTQHYTTIYYLNRELSISMQSNNKSRVAPSPPPCKLHNQHPRAPVFLGPGEGNDHAELVREARQK